MNAFDSSYQEYGVKVAQRQINLIPGIIIRQWAIYMQS